MKWITANDLEQWANTTASRTRLSEVIASLVRASAPAASSFRFPTGDSAQMPDYDGTLDSEVMPPYIPQGISVWEFGTGQNIETKADGDYEKRTEKPGNVVPANSTFVFVTPRRWQKRSEWVAEKKNLNQWKDVQAVDGVALEDWLERNPAVAAKLARELLAVIPANGARSTDEFWDEYAFRFEPVLNEAVLLAGRSEHAKLLIEQLQSPADSHLWLGDSLDEVVAFAVASIRGADQETRKFLEARTLVLDTEQSLHQIAHRSDLIIIARSGALKVPGLLGKRSPAIVPIGREQLNRKDANTLPRPRFDEMAAALKTMGIEEERAQSTARMCGRSVTILARRIRRNVSSAPDWAGKQQLIPALLGGSWSVASEQDKAAIHALAARADYSSYEKELLPFLKMADSPLEREDDAWQVRAPLDAFVQLATLVGDDDLRRLSNVVKTVFGEEDPTINLSPNERFYAPLKGETLRHTGWLRTGLATTLLIMAVFHREAEFEIPGMSPQDYVNKLIAELPGLDVDYRRIASLYGVLPLLAEAAPRPLLQALERLLEGDGERIRPIFKDSENTLFGSSPHTALLWALEVLAWDPEYLNEASLALAKLARIDPGGKLVNRPLNSLREIFVPWHPNTNASLEQRLRAVDYITKEEPNAGWSLLIKLLPEYHSIATPTAKPRYREAGASAREEVTYGLLARTYRAVIDRVLSLTGSNAHRWVTVIQQLSSFSPEDRTRATGSLEHYTSNLTGADAKEIWAALRDEVNRHKRFKDANWAMAATDIDRLDRIVRALEPADFQSQVSWLFDEYHPDLPNHDEDPTREWERISQVRNGAIQRVLEEEGVHAVVDIANAAKLPFFVGFSLAQVGENVEVILKALELALSRTPVPDQFAIALSSAAHHKFGGAWRNVIEQQFKVARLTAQQVGWLMREWNDEPDVWTFAARIGPDVEREYWTVKVPRPLKPQDIEYATAKYVQFGRAVAAIGAVPYGASEIPSEVLFRLLDAAIPELNAHPERISTSFAYHIQQLFVELRKRKDVDRVHIARREYAYLPLLEHEQQQLSLHLLLSEDAGLFVSLICDAFKPASGPEEEISDERRAKARAAYKLLSEFHALPGLKNGSVDAGELNSWIETVRALAADNDRAGIADQYIGHVLAYAPFDDGDSGWPHRVVRDAIEDLASDNIEQGIAVERFNMRGVTTRSLYEGGDQERALALQAREWSTVAASWPRTARMLQRIAEDWERHADMEDVRARQDEMRSN